ncbi:hypothetical protein EDD11_003465 [Mortierella claussenii]|nr:hypothetical protein EDD11_003465 [Mortierella claussenii]
MTRAKASVGTSKDTGVRRSTRAKTQPAATKTSKPQSLTSRPSKGVKTKENVVDSDSDENESEEEVESEEATPTKASKKTVAAPRHSRGSKSYPTKAPVSLKRLPMNGATGSQVPSPSTVTDSEDEEDSVEKEQEEESGQDDENDKEEKEKDDDEDEESFSEEDDEADSDFEEPSEKRKAAREALSRKPRARKEDRIPVIKPRKPKTKALREPREPKLPKGTGTKTSVPKKKKPFTVAPNTTAEDSQDGDEEEQSELYRAVLSSQVALDTVVADWIALYEQSSDEALLNLTNFLIRCCGCKHFVSAKEFAARDDMVETLRTILLQYKEHTSNFDYPIVSKTKEFKKFKKNLLEFYARLIQKAHGDILYDGVFMEILLDWTISLSSSTFRPVRHTAATAALSIMTSLAEIASELQEELNVTNRQLSTSQKQKAAQTKIKQLERRATEARTRESSVLDWIKEIFSSVYVLRCRDVDSLVRLDCVHELGRWMIANSDHFIALPYLPYLGWALTDKAAAVRLEALKALAKLYEMDNHPNALRQFTTRVTERFIEMAIGESDTSARLGAIRVATLIHKHGQLEETGQVKLSGLIFDANARVRKSLAKFVKARVWEEEVEDRMAACELLASSSQMESTAVNKVWVELKSLISFLIKVSKGDDANGPVLHDDEQVTGAGTRLFDETKVGRIALAVEALWSEIDALKNWKSIANYLIEDHSRTPTTSSQKGGKAKLATLEESYHLEEEEENVLLEILIASLQLTLNPPTIPGFQKDKVKVKAQLDDLSNEVGRHCIEILPKLFSKYGVDAGRIRFVLVIPQLIPLNVYLDMRMLASYEEMVDEVIKTFKKHSDPSVLSTAAATLRTIQGYEILRSSHEARIETLGSSIVDTFLTRISQGQDVDIADITTLEELTLCLRRLEHLIKCTDVTIERTRSTNQDPFDALLNVIQRYKAVRDEDAEILVSALSISFLWISWLCRGNASKYDPNADWKEDDIQNLLHKQDSLVRTVSDLATKEDQYVDPRVRRRAFQILGDIYWLFGGDMFHLSKGPNRHLLYMTCPETTQVECENFLRAELDLWDEKVQQKAEALRAARRPKATYDSNRGESEQDEQDVSDNEDSDLEEQNVEEILADEKQAAAQIEQEDKYEMFGTVFSFMRQIILKDFSMAHATTVIARYGHFGAEYDEGVKRVVASIKAQTTEGFSKQARDEKAELFMGVCLDSLKESFEFCSEKHVKSNSHALQLAKVLATAIKPPGFMQSTRVGIEPSLVWQLHRRGITYALEKVAGSALDKEDRKKTARMIAFFDVLSHLPFGPQSAANEITLIQDLIKSECERWALEVEEEEDMWKPLHAYQSKLEKLLQRAVVEQAVSAKKAEEAARLREEEQQQQQQEQAQQVQQEEQDFEMLKEMEMQNVGHQQPEVNRTYEQSNGKKRTAEDEDRDEGYSQGREGDSPAAEGSELDQNPSRNASEPESDRDDRAVKLAKRIRVQ